MLLLLLEMRTLQPWLSMDDLGRLGLGDRALANEIHCSHFWGSELGRHLGVLGNKVSDPLRGEHLWHSYLGPKNSWESFASDTITMSLARLDFGGKRPTTLWSRLMVYFGCSEPLPVSCFYVFTGSMERFTDCYYFEVALSSVPALPVRPRPALSVGLCTDADVLLEKKLLVGWTQQSVALHTDDRTVRHNNQVLRKFNGPPFRAGDVVGCGWQRDQGTWMVFFTENGRLVFRRPTRFDVTLVTAVVVHDANADFRYTTNFGDAPFVYGLKK